MFDRRYFYHVSYTFKEGYSSGFGSTTVERLKKIKSSNDIEDLSEYIKNQLNFDNVVILNWVKIKRG